MNIDSEDLKLLYEYIKISREDGFLDWQIIDELRNAGWTDMLIEEGYKAIENYGKNSQNSIPLIALENITKQYLDGGEKVYALKDIGIQIQKGEFVAIMGPSGSGKSTLMHIMGLLDSPTSGSYKLGGSEVALLGSSAKAKIRSKQIGFVFQQFNLLARTSVLDNVLLPSIYAPTKNDTSRAKELIDRVGLTHRITHKSNQISGGQIQRVAIARALMMDPDIIFADEPTGNLDTRTSEEILDLFNEINKSGTTLVIVTHEEHIASKANRTVRLLDGQIVSDDKF